MANMAIENSTESKPPSTLNRKAMPHINIGITVLIILLVPVLFQVVYQGIRQETRHKEILKRMEELEDLLKGKR